MSIPTSGPASFVRAAGFLAASWCASLAAQGPSPFDIRQQITDAIARTEGLHLEVGRVTDRELSGGTFSVPIRVYEPEGEREPRPVIYHIHSGAYLAGNLDTHDNICRYLCASLEAVVVAVHYRRPPEHPFPTALDDCGFVLRWLQGDLENLGGDGRIFLVGDSAGGHLAAALCIRNADAEQPAPIAGQLLVNPATDLRIDSPAHRTYGFLYPSVFAEDQDFDDPLASPLLQGDLSVFPRTAVVVSEKDAIRSDGLRFDAALRDGGLESELFDLPGQGHLAGDWARCSEVAQPAADFAVSVLRRWMGE